MKEVKKVEELLDTCTEFSKKQKAVLQDWSQRFEIFRGCQIGNGDATDSMIDKWDEQLERLEMLYAEEKTNYVKVLELFMELFTRDFNKKRPRWMDETPFEMYGRKLLALEVELEKRNVSESAKEISRAEMLKAQMSCFKKTPSMFKLYDSSIPIEDTYFYKDYGIKSWDKLSGEEFFFGEFVEFVVDETLMRNTASHSANDPLIAFRIRIK